MGKKRLKIFARTRFNSICQRKETAREEFNWNCNADGSTLLSFFEISFCNRSVSHRNSAGKVGLDGKIFQK
jgi:hypothetical protein